jgi:Rad3-related DNA helicase
MTEFRPDQKIAVARAMHEFDTGVRLVLLDAPTGGGKTICGEAIRRLLGPGRTTYACTDHALQAQLNRDFNYCYDLRGRANYATLDYSDQFDLPWNDPERITCDDCDFKEGECSFCSPVDDCPYRIAKADAVEARLSSTNTSYLLAECNHLGPKSQLSGRNLIILDEADTVEQALWQFEEISISPRMQQSLGLEPPERKTVVTAWAEWFAYAEPVVLAGLRQTNRETPRGAKRASRLARLLERLRAVGPEVAEGRWVYDYSDDFIKFKPIRVDVIANDLLWRHANRWLCMSATLLSREVFCDPLGWYERAAFIQMPSSFPPERRPIRIVPVADMAKKNRAEAWPRLVQALRGMMTDYPNERVLVHTVSFPLTRYLEEHLSSPRVMSYARGSERTSTLDRFRQTDGAVLLAPSMNRGVDLPYRDCSVAVVTQLPYPDLGDKQVAARRFSPGGQTWYVAEMIRKVAQSVGRHHRAADDTSVTFVLDSRWQNVRRQWKQIIPRFVEEATVTTGDHARRWLGGGMSTT